jgi:hypothetical protein
MNNNCNNGNNNAILAHYKETRQQLGVKGQFIIIIQFFNSIEKSAKLAIVIEYMTTEFPFIMKYERLCDLKRPCEKFCDMLYTKSPVWVAQSMIDGTTQGQQDGTTQGQQDGTTQGQQDGTTQGQQLRQIIYNFKTVYETIKYQDWVCLRDKYGLDSNIMFIISGYLNHYVRT